MNENEKIEKLDGIEQGSVVLLLSQILDGFATLEESLQEVKTASTGSVNNLVDPKIVMKALEERLRKTKLSVDTTKIDRGDLDMLSSAIAELKAIRNSLKEVEIKKLNESISKIENVKVEHVHGFTTGFDKFLYRWSPLAIVLLITVSLGMFWWTQESIAEVYEKKRELEAKEGALQNILETTWRKDQVDWLFDYYDYMGSKHPKDDANFKSIKPIPEEIKYKDL